MRSLFKPRLALLGILPLGVFALALSSMLGMELLEGEPRGFWQSLAWASETLTTTGYGHDNQWRHPIMIAFVVTAQFLGVFLIFLLFPVFVIPYFESRFEKRLPRVVPDKLRGFVLIFRYGPAVTSLINDIEREQVAAVVLEEDELLGRRLRDRGLTVVQSRLDDEDLFGGGLERARALVVNGPDHENAVAVLSARRPHQARSHLRDTAQASARRRRWLQAGARARDHDALGCVKRLHTASVGGLEGRGSGRIGGE